MKPIPRYHGRVGRNRSHERMPFAAGYVIGFNMVTKVCFSFSLVSIRNMVGRISEYISSRKLRIAYCLLADMSSAKISLIRFSNIFFCDF